MIRGARLRQLARRLETLKIRVDQKPDFSAGGRMRDVDELPAVLRELVYMHGLNIVRAFQRAGIKNGERMGLLIQLAMIQRSAGESEMRRAGMSPDLVRYVLDRLPEI